MEQKHLNVSGRIFDIQKFSIHDGPGIRTIVFLKGCIFRCMWCCNPESQSFDIQSMKINNKKKTMGRDITVREIIEIVEKDRAYYRRSGGGITLSGGECLCQPKFSKALLYSAKQKGISTAIETTGGVNFEIIKDILEDTDTIMMDIKHINPIKHKNFTGRDNSLILENAKKIAKQDVNFIIRVPVIPGFNDKEDEIKQIANYVKSLETVTELHLLPYHRLGMDKYKGLDREYTLEHLKVPKDEKMKRLLEIVNSTGLEGQIGG